MQGLPPSGSEKPSRSFVNAFVLFALPASFMTQKCDANMIDFGAPGIHVLQAGNGHEIHKRM